MGDTQAAKPVAMMAAVFSRHETALAWARTRLEQQFGAISLSSDPFPFVQTDYYDKSMGEGIQKQFHLLEGLRDGADLADWKLLSNQWEQEFAEQGGYPEHRPLNIDPGYVTEAKLVLATTKDRDHRIYLRDNIYAEVTLYYHGKQWCTRPWTYPDYTIPIAIDFLNQSRERLRHWGRSL